MPPVPLNAEQIKRLDPDFEERANALCADAMKGVTRSKGTVALKQWYNDADFMTLAAETTLKAGVSVASGFAIGAVAAAGVAAAAVTFGVAPALGLVVGIAVSKGLGEYHYQSASNELRRAIKARGGDHNTMPLDKLPEAVTKVLKKYIRVARRGKQLLGGARGAAYNVRHMTTTIRAALNRSDVVIGDNLTTNPEFKKDNELVRRLLEFRYYAQMTYNTVSDKLDVVVYARNRHLEHSQLYFAHILRQVHFTGNHEHCGLLSCYNLSSADFRTNCQRVGLSVPRGNAVTSGYHARTDAAAVRQGAVASHANLATKAFKDASDINIVKVRQMNTAHLRTLIQNAPPAAPEHTTMSAAAKEVAKEEAREKITEGIIPGVLGDMATGSSDRAAGGFANWSGSIAHNQTQQVSYTSFNSTGSVGSVPFGAAVGAGVGAGADLAISFVKERYQRRQVRKKVLSMQKAVEEMLDYSHVAAHDELEKFAKLEKEDMGRIAEKIIWYGKKITELESDPTFCATAQAIGSADKSFSNSAFPKCDDAYNLWFAIQYLLRQYGKIIANLVCMEVLLLKLDSKLAHMGIGVTAGTLVKEGVGSWPRPVHMKNIDD
jgi:hypothetical protein